MEAVLHIPASRAKPISPMSFDELCQRYRKQVIRIAWRLTGQLADAEDVAQEAFLRLHHHWRDLQDPGPWLCRVTVNLCRDRHRALRPTGPVPENPPADGRSPEAQEVARQARAALAEAIALLPERERAALVLRELEGFETAEVAAILGVTEVTVRTHVHSAKQKLKAEMEKRQWKTRS